MELSTGNRDHFEELAEPVDDELLEELADAELDDELVVAAGLLSDFVEELLSEVEPPDFVDSDLADSDLLSLLPESLGVASMVLEPRLSVL
ncbi:hypothetical protein [Parenemella sanctibonifatiensis]|uniref:hypothetical protein n=1 Tax=Parenemella sanctibonifatiensis TaxID=2016505 RepID=UPI0026D02B2D